MNTEKIFAIIFISLILGIIVHQWYLVWFKPTKYREMAIKGFQKLPEWYPFRDLNISWYETYTSIWVIRFLTSIALIVLLFIGIDSLYSFLTQTMK
jgi:hypothetical protein